MVIEKVLGIWDLRKLNVFMYKEGKSQNKERVKVSGAEGVDLDPWRGRKKWN